jgi:inosose dehydratase
MNFGDHIRRQAAGLARLAAMSEYFGIGLNVEAPHHRGLCQTVEDAEQLLDAITADNVRILIDVAHVTAGGTRPDLAASRFAGRIGHVHLRDARGKDIFQTPGDGDIHFSNFFQALEASGYPGWCAVELEIPDNSLEGRRRELARSLDHLLPQAAVTRGYRRGEP